MDRFQAKGAMQCINDDTMGPIVRGCRDEFDFTRTFEQIFLSLFPSIVFILAAATRITHLSKRPHFIVKLKLPAAKGIVALALFALNILLAIATCLRSYGGKYPVQTAAVAAAASGALIPLLSFEHSKSLKPSTAICVFLSVSLLCDAVQIRTSFLSEETPFSAILIAIAAFKFLLLLLEGKNKQNLLPPETGSLSPEGTSSPIGKCFFWWLNELLRRGYTEQLEAGDLYPLDKQLDAEKYQARFFLAYKANLSNGQDTKAKPWLLIRALVSTLNSGLVAPIPARIANGVFAFSQPFFINSMLTYLQADSTSTSNSVSFAYVGIIGFLYVGSAVSSGIYWYYHQRALLGIRSCLVTAIYRKTIYRKTYSSENSAAITLMNSEVNIVQSGLYSFHEFWASVIETAVASWLLQRQIGAAFVSPLIIVTLCTVLVFGTGKFASKRQGQWMESLGKRVGLTSLVIPNLPAIKMSGLGSQVGLLIQLSREREISVANRFRILLAFSATISFVPIVLAPIVTFTLSRGSLSISKVFTSLAFINLLCNPFIRVLQNAAQLLAAITSLGRIQKFLDSEAHDEAGSIDKYSDEIAQERAQTEGAFVVLKEASFSWTNAKRSVENVSFSIMRGSQTLVAGPVGSGKTTLCLGILKETPYAEGFVHLKTESRLAYCSQDPFILNGTIRENIVGFADYETDWYNKVVECCQLVEDFNNLAQRDQTKVGSRGIALSGGQRKRIGLARAVYSRPEIAILDDVFGGIDTNTTRELERRVFSHDGIFRQMETAVLLCSQSTDQAVLFDDVVVLRDGAVTWCGSPIELPFEYGIVQKAATEAQDSTNDKNISIENNEMRNITAKTTSTPPDGRVLRLPGGFANYRFYFSAVGFKAIALYFVLVLVASFLFSSSALWLELWVQHQNDDTKESFYFRMYWALQLTCVAALSVYIVFCENVMSPRASSKLHFGTLKAIFGAPLDYYTTVDSSVPTGYMSQDMSVLDTTFTNVFANTVVSIFITGFQSVIIGLASPLILVAYPVVWGMLYFVQKVYLRTSTQLRFLAMETREPLM
jgi:ABC-type multidrug transport system fused ATPase/permease subunit